MKKNIVSIIITSWNRPTVLYKTVLSVLKQKNDFLELIIIDQGGYSGRRILDIIRKNPDVSIIYAKPNYAGLCQSRNLGLQKAKGEIVMFLDDDAIPHAHLFAWHEKSYQPDKVLGVAGRVLERGVNENSDPVGKVSRFGAKYEMNFANKKPQSVDFTKGANMSFRKKALLDVGGFDERLSAAFDEIDICFRLRKKRGATIIFQPKACVDHIHYKTGGTRNIELDTYRRNYYFDFGLFFRNNFPLFYLPFFLFFQFRFFYKDINIDSFQKFFAGLSS